MEETGDPIVCSRCKTAYPCIPGYKGQADGCNCSLWLPSKLPEKEAVPQVPEGELPAFWVSSAFDAYNNCEWNAGYGSNHDMDRFAFVDVASQEVLDREAIVARYTWVRFDEQLDLCDTCIDAMLILKQLKCVWSFDSRIGIDSDSSE